MRSHHPLGVCWHWSTILHYDTSIHYEPLANRAWVVVALYDIIVRPMVATLMLPWLTETVDDLGSQETKFAELIFKPIFFFFFFNSRLLAQCTLFHKIHMTTIYWSSHHSIPTCHYPGYLHWATWPQPQVCNPKIDHRCLQVRFLPANLEKNCVPIPDSDPYRNLRGNSAAVLLKFKASAVTLLHLPISGTLIFNLNNELWKYISPRRFVDQECHCQLFPWNL